MAAGCCCGSLIGGETAIGFLFGRTEENGFCPAVCGHVARQLHDRFVEHNRVTCCRVLHRDCLTARRNNLKPARSRAVEAARIAAEVIVGHFSLSATSKRQIFWRRAPGKSPGICGCRPPSVCRRPGSTTLRITSPAPFAPARVISPQGTARTSCAPHGAAVYLYIHRLPSVGRGVPVLSQKDV